MKFHKILRSAASKGYRYIPGYAAFLLRNLTHMYAILEMAGCQQAFEGKSSETEIYNKNIPHRGNRSPGPGWS